MTEEPTARRAANPWIAGRPPHIPAAAADVPAACLLPGDPARVALAAQVFDEFDVVGQNREFVFGVGTLGGTRVGVCSTGIGGPSAEIAVVELQRLGASVLIRVGGTAALRHQVPLGTVCTVTRAVRWGGAARPYSPAAAQATPDRELLARLRQEGHDLGTELADVEVVSTDSYYLGQGRLLPGLEGPASREWTALLAQDVDALDMESETVLTVGRAVGARAASLLVVHANRATDAWLEDYEGPQLRMLKLAAHTAVAASRLPRLPAPPSC